MKAKIVGVIVVKSVIRNITLCCEPNTDSLKFEFFFVIVLSLLMWLIQTFHVEKNKVNIVDIIDLSGI